MRLDGGTAEDWLGRWAMNLMLALLWQIFCGRGIPKSLFL
jgi:hypothetical protein